jgi:hypothetical protein
LDPGLIAGALDCAAKEPILPSSAAAIVIAAALNIWRRSQPILSGIRLFRNYRTGRAGYG